mmetsp:Transcript_29802/g.72008  ORF Transcript_29802/g.72008 Transcript_29802/m.72008 type:complete len:96 (+) Transcript_29802:269-556(+)
MPLGSRRLSPRYTASLLVGENQTREQGAGGDNRGIPPSLEAWIEQLEPEELVLEPVGLEPVELERVGLERVGLEPVGLQLVVDPRRFLHRRISPF